MGLLCQTTNTYVYIGRKNTDFAFQMHILFSKFWSKSQTKNSFFKVLKQTFKMQMGLRARKINVFISQGETRFFPNPLAKFVSEISIQLGP